MNVPDHWHIDLLKTFHLFLTHIHFYPQTLFLRKKHTPTPTIHKLFLSMSLNACVYTSHTQVCTQKCCSSLSTLLSKKSGSTLMCEWRCAPPPPSVPPSLTIHKHHSSACCLMWKLHPHFLSAWEIFFLFCGGPWSSMDEVRFFTSAPLPPAKASLDREIEAKCESSLAGDERSAGEAGEAWDMI